MYATLNNESRRADALHMTFTQHLDAHIAGPTPVPSYNGPPEDGSHRWFVDTHTKPDLTGLPVPVAQQAQGEQVNPTDVGWRQTWSTPQWHALRTLRTLGARLGDDPTAHDVRTAWRRLAKRLHPDAAGNRSSVSAFTRAAEAWEALRKGPSSHIGRTDVFAQGWRHAS